MQRTFPEHSYFKGKEGRSTLTRLLTALSNHSSSVGYTQGMNAFAGSILLHTDEVLAFELVIRTLNDYNLKEVHMAKLHGLYVHCDILQVLLQENLPKLNAHLSRLDVTTMNYCANWVVSLLSQVVPLSQVQLFYSQFFKDGWLAFYKVILTLMSQLQDQILNCSTTLTAQLSL